MAEDLVRWPGGTARLSSWRGHADVAYLAVGADRPPGNENVERCLHILRDQGYASVVTNALGLAETLPFVDAGFEVRERLHLLTHDLSDLPEAPLSTRRGRAGDLDAVLAIDSRSFSPFWRMDTIAIARALDATPATRYRVIALDGVVMAYAITGRSGRRGYLQRLAVDPDAQGRGIGRTVVADALRWLRRHRADRALVNTQLDNDAALSLYRRCGFRDLPAGLCVMGRDL